MRAFSIRNHREEPAEPPQLTVNVSGALCVAAILSPVAACSRWGRLAISTEQFLLTMCPADQMVSLSATSVE